MQGGSWRIQKRPDFVKGTVLLTSERLVAAAIIKDQGL